MSSSPPCARALGRGRQAAFVAPPRLLFAGPGARAVDSHLPSGLFGGEGVSLSVVGHSGTVGALDGGREVVGRRAGLRGGSGQLSGSGTVDFVALRVALRRWAGVDAVGVALSSRLGRPPAFPGGFDQILQRDGSSLHGRRETERKCVYRSVQDLKKSLKNTESIFKLVPHVQ